MSNFSKERKVEGLKRLGDFLLEPDEAFKALIPLAKNKNGWFTQQEIEKAIEANGQMLNHHDLKSWTDTAAEAPKNAKKIGLILAGNLPLVGFHDILAVFISGHVALIKLSSQDDVLIPAILKKLVEFEPSYEHQFQFVNRLADFDAVIATGSNNSSRYFDYYFAKVPHIIRKNRNSIAILSGEESSEELRNLGKDIFDYYGLGCRNVSKMMVPKGYIFNHFFESIEEFSPILNHHKYQNNYDYNKSIYLVNRVEHLDNGFLLLTQNTQLASPLSVVFYEEYENLADLTSKINTVAEEIQVVVTKQKLNINCPTVDFGESQHPKLWDYADGVNTLEFLAQLS